MSPVFSEFLKKLAYTVGGVVVAGLVSFLTQNPVILGGSTAIVVGLLSAVEEAVWPSTTVSSQKPIVPSV